MAETLAREVPRVARPLIVQGLQNVGGVQSATLTEHQSWRKEQRHYKEESVHGHPHLSVARYAVTSCRFLFSGSSSASTIFLCASFGSFTSTFGTSPSRAIDLRVPSASVRMTRKSSLRTSLPSNFFPSGMVTVTGRPAPPPRRPPNGLLAPL